MAEVDQTGNMSVLNAPAVLGELDEAQIRVDLAAAFRIAARMDLHESVSNHFLSLIHI